MSHRSYFDHAAATPVVPEAARAFRRAQKVFANPSSVHAEGVAARAVLEGARARVARALAAKPDAIVFTSGATESNNMAVQGAVLAARAAGISTPHLLVLPSAHASAWQAAQALSRDGVIVEKVPLREGAIDLSALQTLLRSETVLIALEAVCGETGARFDTRSVAQLVKERGSTAQVFVDASQLPRVESVEWTRLGADLLSLDAQKVGGERGCGVLFVPRQARLAPLLYGGGQERGLRPGTPAPALAAAFAAALEVAARDRQVFARRAAELRRVFLAECAVALPHMVVNEGKENAPHILNISLPGQDTEYLVMLLDAAGFAVSARSACDSDVSYSRAVEALTGDAARARATLRISFGPQTRLSEARRLSRALAQCSAFLDSSKIQ